MDLLSLYLHIPFCRVKCSYCDFNTYANLENSFESYTNALCKEVSIMGRHYGRPVVKTIFIGGGTPTILKIPQPAKILAACYTAFHILPNAEITSEANPGTVDVSYLRRLLTLGVNRLSFGAQSFNPAELTMLGRIHTASAIGSTIIAARRAGAENINLDLIYGLPKQTLDMWRRTLAEAVALETEHISLYSLTLERGTALRAQVARGELPQPDSDLAADMYDLADEVLAEAGYTQYEISNWCKPGFECRHNLTYWQNRPYLGFGPGAHSFNNRQRWWNVRPVAKYIALIEGLKRPSSPRPALAGYEDIDLPLEMAETVILGLRLTQTGVSLPAFERRFGKRLTDVFTAEISKLKALGLLIEEDQRLRLSSQARLLGNQVFMHFLP